MRSLVLALGFSVALLVVLAGVDTAAAQCTVAGASCDDGMYCTEGETCSSTLVCQGGTPRSCDDLNDCTTNACNEAASRCDHMAQPAGTACSDGQYCTTSDMCVGSVCAGGPVRSCNDDEICTADLCNRSTDSCSNALIPGWCRIRGECVTAGTPDGSSACEQCIPTISTNRYETAPAGTSCGDASCTGGDLTPNPSCNAAGSCAVSEVMPCRSGECATTTSCADCTVDGECATDQHCSSGTCVASLETGGSCDRSAQCIGGECHDGVCCDRACGGGCEACDGAGVCAPHPAATDPEGACPAGVTCDGLGSCVGESDAAVGTDSGTDSGTGDSSVGFDTGAGGDGATGNLSVHGSGCIACSIGARPRGHDFQGLAWSVLLLLGLALRRRR